MTFDQREWVNDLATGTITGVVGGLALAMLVPDPPFLEAMLGGGAVGVVTGAITLPLKWLLNRRPEAIDPANSKTRHSKASGKDRSSGDVGPKKEES